MARRRFRYDPQQGRMVEIPLDGTTDFGAPAVRDDIVPFISPIDGSIINSQSALRDHMGQHGVIPHEDAKHAKVEDRYAAERDKRGRMERLWELTDRAIRTGKAT
jgi:hypothetical protein